MKIKLSVTVKPGDTPITVTTNMFCITEWEKDENRKMSDGRGIGAGDLCCWAYHMFKQMGYPVKENTWREWLKNNPEIEIEGIDQTDPNPTGAAATAAN
jgi:hypothetical protein